MPPPQLPDSRPTNRLLLVEDDPDIIPLFARGLRQVNPVASLIWTLDSEAAIALIETGLCDAVVADYAIEGASTGWALLELCRTREPALPFGLTSALPLRSVETNGTPFLAKPFAIRDVVRFLRLILPGAQAALANDATSLASASTALSAPH
jgi:DNA-binding response OmpR family regulator